MLSLKKYFEYAQKLGFSDVEFKINSTKKLSLGVFHHSIEKYEISQCETIGIRGIYNGNMVSATTENKKNICAILDQMVKNAELIEEKKQQEIFAGSEKYKNKRTYSDALSKVSIKDKKQLLLDIEQKCYDYSEKISEARINYRESEQSLRIVNSKGLKLSYKTNVGMIMATAIAKDNGDTRMGMDRVCGQSFEKLKNEELVKNVCDSAINALHGQPCLSGKYKVILQNNVFADLLRIFMGAVSGDNVNKKQSMLMDKLSQQVAGSKLTVTEDPFTKEYPFMDRCFDDEGVATIKKAIVEKGVLKTFLYDMESAKQAKVTSTGNGYGEDEIGIRTAFLKVKPGKKSLEELAQTVKNGLLITNAQGMHAGMNGISGDFSLQSGGYLIENGKITTPVTLITIAGNLYEVFKRISEVGSDSKLSMMGIDTPSVIVKELAISGK